MEPVSHLRRLRGAGPDGLGIRSGPVPAHHLDLGVLAQPGGRCAGFAVRQHVHGPVGVHVDQNRAVRGAAADREVVDTQHRDPPCFGQRPGADQPDQHITTARHAEFRRDAGAGPPGQRERDLGQRRSQRRSTPGERGGQARDLLGERRLRTAGVDAFEPAHPDHDLGAAPADRQIGKATQVAGMDTIR
jgi:hypothetical protein